MERIKYWPIVRLLFGIQCTSIFTFYESTQDYTKHEKEVIAFVTKIEEFNRKVVRKVFRRGWSFFAPSEYIETFIYHKETL